MKKKLVIVMTLLTTLVGIGRSMEAPASSRLGVGSAALCAQVGSTLQ